MKTEVIVGTEGWAVYLIDVEYFPDRINQSLPNRTYVRSFDAEEVAIHYAIELSKKEIGKVVATYENGLKI